MNGQEHCRAEVHRMLPIRFSSTELSPVGESAVNFQQFHCKLDTD